MCPNIKVHWKVIIVKWFRISTYTGILYRWILLLWDKFFRGSVRDIFSETTKQNKTLICNRGTNTMEVDSLISWSPGMKCEALTFTQKYPAFPRAQGCAKSVPLNQIITGHTRGLVLNTWLSQSWPIHCQTRPSCLQGQLFTFLTRWVTFGNFLNS